MKKRSVVLFTVMCFVFLSALLVNCSSSPSTRNIQMAGTGWVVSQNQSYHLIISFSDTTYTYTEYRLTSGNNRGAVESFSGNYSVSRQGVALSGRGTINPVNDRFELNSRQGDRLTFRRITQEIASQYEQQARTAREERDRVEQQVRAMRERGQISNYGQETIRTADALRQRAQEAEQLAQAVRQLAR